MYKVVNNISIPIIKTFFGFRETDTSETSETSKK